MVLDYVNAHHEETIEAERRAEEFVQRRIAEQKAKGLHREIDESVLLEQRIARIREIRQRQIAKRNGGHNSR